MAHGLLGEWCGCVEEEAEPPEPRSEEERRAPNATFPFVNKRPSKEAKKRQCKRRPAVRWAG